MKRTVIGISVRCLISVICLINEASALDVVFLPQVPPGAWAYTKHCGPVSVITTVAFHEGKTPSSTDIENLDDWLVEKRIWSDDNAGNGYITGTPTLNKIAREYFGFDDIVTNSENDLDFIKEEIINHNPVIVGVTLDMDPSRTGHFMVITDINDSTVTVNDPGHSVENPNHQRTYTHSQFLSSWATQNYAALVIRSKVGRLATSPEWSEIHSQSFLTAYQEYGGYDQIGFPWSNPCKGCPNTQYVHNWPDDGSFSPALLVQDFISS